jgi:hypothetical protein
MSAHRQQHSFLSALVTHPQVRATSTPASSNGN